MKGSESDLFKLLMDNVREYAVFTTDPGRRILTWNAGAHRILGYSDQEALGRSADLIFTEEDRMAGGPEHEAATAEREGQAADERWHVRSDGSRFWGSGVMTALREPDGSLRGFGKVLRDNTRRKEAEEALSQALAEVERVNGELETRVEERTQQVRALSARLMVAEQQERNRLAHILHDDLQQQIYGATMLLSLASRDAPDDDQQQLLADVMRTLDEAARLTRTLVSEITPIVLPSDRLSDVFRALQERKRRLGLHVEVEGEAEVTDPAIQSLVYQLAREVLFNVVKHANTDRAVVTLRHEGGFAIVQVQDDGDGFDASVLDAEGGAGGFGLPSVHERLQLIGGRLEVVSTRGRGTRVTLYVPDHGDAGERHAPPPPPSDRDS